MSVEQDVSVIRICLSIIVMIMIAPIVLAILCWAVVMVVGVVMMGWQLICEYFGYLLSL